MKNMKKKGFTLVELLVVIAIIAILATVSVVGYTTFINKANMSADQQAVVQMNTILTANSVVKRNTLNDVYDTLEANGFTAEDYRPLTKNTAFVWDQSLDRILHVSADYATIHYPTEYTIAEKGDWFNLVNSKTETEKPADYDAAAAEIKVANAAQFAYVVEAFNNGETTAETLTVNLDGKTIDMNGAALTFADGENGNVTKDITLINGTIKNVNGVDAAFAATNGADGADGKYHLSALFGYLVNGAEVTIKDVVIENVHLKDTDASNAAFLVANAGGGKVTIENVTIKNSSVIGHRNVGALVGNNTDTKLTDNVTIKGAIVLDNVQVQAVGGRSGLLFGYIKEEAVVLDASATITLKNGTAYGIYECDQNKGTFQGTQLGYNAETGMITSYAYTNGNPAIKTYTYFANAYATKWATGGAQTNSTFFDGVVTVVK